MLTYELMSLSHMMQLQRDFRDRPNLCFRMTTNARWQTPKCHWILRTMQRHTGQGWRSLNLSEATGREDSISCCHYLATAWVSATSGGFHTSATTMAGVSFCGEMGRAPQASPQGCSPRNKTRNHAKNESPTFFWYDTDTTSSTFLCCRGNVFTEPLPSNDGVIHI
jgi:hypothetical protein